MFRQILLGVCLLHVRGIAHFDLKRENIPIDENRRLKIGSPLHSFFFLLILFPFQLTVGKHLIFVWEGSQLVITGDGVVCGTHPFEEKQI
jgi:serine/threonine protein kinase